MSQIIVFKNLDGSCGVIHPTSNPSITETITIKTIENVTEEYEITYEEIDKYDKVIEKTRIAFRVVPKEVEKQVEVERLLSIEEIARKDVPEGLSYRITTVDKLPTDRQYRNAWTDDFISDTVDVHLDKARDIHMGNIRRKRSEKFIKMGFPTKLDPDLEKAIIPEGTRKELQTLRDIPDKLDLFKASNVEELKAMWPVELN